MVFEEDFLFFPGGQGPDDADGYGKHPVKMFVQRGFDAVQGSQSLPPQSPSPRPIKGQEQWQGRQASAGEPIPLNLQERLFGFKG